MPPEKEKDDADNVNGEEDKADGEDEDFDKQEDEILDDKDYQPETRKSVGEYVAERRVKRAKKKATQGENGDGEEDDKGDEGDEEEAPDIGEQIQKAVKPMTDFVRNQTIDSEINACLFANPQFKKFAKLIKKDAIAYPNTPILKIARALAFDETETAKNIKTKKEEAKNKKLGGLPNRRGNNAPVKPSLISDDKLKEVRLRTKAGEKINPLELE